MCGFVNLCSSKWKMVRVFLSYSCFIMVVVDDISPYCCLMYNGEMGMACRKMKQNLVVETSLAWTLRVILSEHEQQPTCIRLVFCSLFLHCVDELTAAVCKSKHTHLYVTGRDVS